jgi:hypothetical protein
MNEPGIQILSLLFLGILGSYFSSLGHVEKTRMKIFA